MGSMIRMGGGRYSDLVDKYLAEATVVAPSESSWWYIRRFEMDVRYYSYDKKEE